VVLTIVTYNAHKEKQSTLLPAESRWFNSPWIKSPWRLPSFLILFFLVQLIFDLRRTAPVTRGVIFDITVDMAGIVWGAVLSVMIVIARELDSQTDVSRKVLNMHLDITKDIVNMLQELNRSQSEISMSILETLKETASREAVKKVLYVMESMNDELEKVKQKTDRRTGIAGLFRR
jgi:multisubunit Na+/H+ antiporter MnhE subunit